MKIPQRNKKSYIYNYHINNSLSRLKAACNNFSDKKMIQHIKSCMRIIGNINIITIKKSYWDSLSNEDKIKLSKKFAKIGIRITTRSTIVAVAGTPAAIAITAGGLYNHRDKIKDGLKRIKDEEKLRNKVLIASGVTAVALVYFIADQMGLPEEAIESVENYTNERIKLIDNKLDKIFNLIKSEEFLAMGEGAKNNILDSMGIGNYITDKSYTSDPSVLAKAYDYSIFRDSMTWTNIGDSGMNTREFLIDKELSEKGILSDPFSGKESTNIDEFDIDHRIPLSQIMDDNPWIYNISKEDQLAIFNDIDNLQIMDDDYNQQVKGSQRWEDYSKSIPEEDTKNEFITKARLFEEKLSNHPENPNNIQGTSAKVSDFLSKIIGQAKSFNLIRG